MAYDDSSSPMYHFYIYIYRYENNERERVRGLCLAQRAANNISIVTANYFKIIIITCVLVYFFHYFLCDEASTAFAQARGIMIPSTQTRNRQKIEKRNYENELPQDSVSSASSVNP